MGRGNVFKVLNFFLSAVNSEMSFSVEILLKIRKKDRIDLNVLMLRGKKIPLKKTEKCPLWTDLD